MTRSVTLGLLLLCTGMTAASTVDAQASDSNAQVSDSDAQVSDSDAQVSDSDAQAPATPQRSDEEGPKKAKSGDREKVAQANTGRGRRSSASRIPADDGEDEEKVLKAPPRVPWRGSAIGWDNSVTASALGIGRDFQSDAHQSYVQTFSLGLNYFLLDEDGWSIAVATGPSFSVELTDSAQTTTRREPWFNDLNTSVVLRSRWYADKSSGYATGGIFNHTLLFPTSPASGASGTVITTSPRFMHWHAIPLLPKDVSPVFNSVFIGASIRWDHRFGLATTAVNDNLQRTRQNARGETLLSDQLAFSRITQDTLRQGFFLFFAENFGPTTFQWFVAMSMNQRFTPTLDGGDSADCVVQIDTGCVPDDVTHNDGVIGDTPDTQFGYGFAVGMSFFPMTEWGVNLSYANSSNSLAPDGTRRGPFYSPQAQFSAGLVISLDAIYERATGPERSSPFVLMGKNEKNPQRKTRGPSSLGMTF